MDALGRMGTGRGFKSRLQWLCKGVCPSPLVDAFTSDDGSAGSTKTPSLKRKHADASQDCDGLSGSEDEVRDHAASTFT